MTDLKLQYASKHA